MSAAPRSRIPCAEEEAARAEDPAFTGVLERARRRARTLRGGEHGASASSHTDDDLIQYIARVCRTTPAAVRYAAAQRAAGGR